MSYKMRFVQYFDKRDSTRFLELEREFVALEEKTPGMALGKRYVPVISQLPTNCMVWEAEYDTMEAAVAALRAIEENPEHDELLDQQIKYMRDTYVEIYRELI